MNKALISCVGLLAALAIVQPAVADEPPSKPKRQRVAAPERAAPQRAAPTQASNWSGGQVGGSNGVSSVNNNFVEPGAYICPPGSSFGSNCLETPFQFSGHKAVYTIGPFVGYRVQFGNWVVGIEGDASYKKAENSLFQSSSTALVVSSGGTGAFTSNFLRTDQFSGSVKQGWDYSIRGRLGTLITPWSLLYLTGGVAFGEISGTFAYTGTLYNCFASSGCTSAVGTASTAVSWNDTRVGGTVGAGWETEIAPGWKARAEYRYTDFGSYTKTFNLSTACSSCAAPSSSVSIDLKESFHTFRIGLGFDL